MLLNNLQSKAFLTIESIVKELRGNIGKKCGETNLNNPLLTNATNIRISKVKFDELQKKQSIQSASYFLTNELFTGFELANNNRASLNTNFPERMLAIERYLVENFGKSDGMNRAITNLCSAKKKKIEEDHLSSNVVEKYLYIYFFIVFKIIILYFQYLVFVI